MPPIVEAMLLAKTCNRMSRTVRRVTAVTMTSDTRVSRSRRSRAWLSSAMSGAIVDTRQTHANMTVITMRNPTRHSSRKAQFAAAMRRWAPLLVGTGIGLAFSLAVGFAMGSRPFGGYADRSGAADWRELGD